MSEGQILARAREALEQRKQEREDMFKRRRAEVFAENPEAEKLDREIRALPVKMMRAAMTDNEDRDEMLSLIKQESFMLRSQLSEELALMGLPPDWLDESPYCKKCNDSGYIGSRRCDCLKELINREQVRELSDLVDIRSDTFSGFRLSYYDDTPGPDGSVSPREQMEVVYSVCRKFASKFGQMQQNLFMSGDTGLGKTFLSTCIAHDVSKAGFSVVYASAANCFSRFEKEKFSRDGEEYSEYVERCLGCDLLILDDLGTEMTTNFVVSILYRIVNTRLASGKSTIISSNLSPDMLSGRYSPAIYSRIAGEYKYLRFAGSDIRTMGLS